MGGPRTRFDTFFGVAQMVIAMNGWQNVPPTAIVDVMRAVFEVPASPPAEDGEPCVKDAVMVALTCLAQYSVKLAEFHQQQQPAVGPPAASFPTQATRQPQQQAAAAAGSSRQPQPQAAAHIPRPINVPMPVLQVPLYPNLASAMVSAHNQGLVHLMTWLGESSTTHTQTCHSQRQSYLHDSMGGAGDGSL